MLKEISFSVIYLALCVMGEKTLGEPDEKILKTLGPTLIIVIAFCVLVVLMLVLLVKRQLLRVLLLSKRGAHTSIASGAPRKLAQEIDASICRVERMKVEPRMLAENIQQLTNEESRLQSGTHRESGHHLYNLRYRFKAVDAMTCFDDLLCSIDVEYCRKSHQTVRDHLLSLLTPPRAPLAGSEDICDKVIKLYEHARYGKKEFGQREYHQISSYIEDLKARLRQKVVIPGTLVSSDTAASSKDISRSPKGPTHRAKRTKPTAVFYTSTKNSSGTVKV